MDIEFSTMTQFLFREYYICYCKWFTLSLQDVLFLRSIEMFMQNNATINFVCFLKSCNQQHQTTRKYKI